MYSLTEIDWDELTKGPFQASPVAWEDQAFYFLLLDRFSDGKERGYYDNECNLVDSGKTPPFNNYKDGGNAVKTKEQAERWVQAGGTWCGGNIKGLTSKLGYLQRMGVTALWISPVLKQCAHIPDSFHGYGTQDFLSIDPHLGTAEDLRELTKTAHEMGMYVILDIILNHTGDVFGYKDEAGATYTGEQHEVAGFRNSAGAPEIPFKRVDKRRWTTLYPDNAVWPVELQDPEAYNRMGRIGNWDWQPEYEEGDFFILKDVKLGIWENDQFQPSQALKDLIKIYQYWIAYADLDGFRLDTAKHMPPQATAYFTQEIHQFAESIGKRNFYIIAEFVGERQAATDLLKNTGLNASLGIGEIPQKIRGIAHGWTPPSEYFGIFAHDLKNKDASEESLWWRDRVVTMFDDHDQVGQPTKRRLMAEVGDTWQSELLVLRALAFQMLTLGIPCIYYGTEQCFDGRESSSEELAGASPESQIRYIRECMFGGDFGAFRSRERHFFNERSRLYQEISKLLALRKTYGALRRGRQFLREISLDGTNFWFPAPIKDPYQGLIAWSRLLDIDEFVCVINTDPVKVQSAFVTLDTSRHGPGSRPLRCIYSTDAVQIDTETPEPEEKNGSAVWITLPPGGVAVFR